LRFSGVLYSNCVDFIFNPAVSCSIFSKLFYSIHFRYWNSLKWIKTMQVKYCHHWCQWMV